ncbi:MAG: hypothetical protein JXA98_04825 [Methanosarcinaceae archaeon]|nr:hypothetical protein [Methanosarcinaceae archaeon]
MSEIRRRLENVDMIRKRALEKIEELDLSKTTKKEMSRSFEVRLDSFSDGIVFYRSPFTPVSVTGTGCELNCKHCEKHYLKHMLDASHGKLSAIAHNLAVRGHRGILLSGGSRTDGSVPTYEISDEIHRIKDDTHLKISAHTGIVTDEQAERLSPWLDMALVDCIGSEATISGILGLPNTVDDYDSTLRFLTENGIPIAPHIIVGLNHGKLDGEFSAIEMVKKYKPDVVVIVVFIPTKGTACADAPSPLLEDVAKVIIRARQEMPDIPLSLSCVRPGGRYRSQLDECAILCGIDRIAVPSRSAYKLCKDVGLEIHEVDKLCCSYEVIV